MKKKNRFLANKTFVVFSILAVCIILTAVFAPVVTRGVDPLKGSLVDALLPPCKEHIFGTDKMGRDIFSRVIYGARASLSATFGVVALIFLWELLPESLQDISEVSLMLLLCELQI